MYSGFAFDGRRKLSKRDFRENLRLRLGLGLHNGISGTQFICGCRHEESLLAGVDEHHALSCPKRGEQQLRLRHDLVVQALTKFLRTIIGPAGQVISDPNRVSSGVQRVWRPDITATVGPATHHIDVSVVNPAARTYYTDLGSGGSDLVPDAANRAQEQLKRAKMRMALGSHTADRCGVPFVLEITGRWGPSATAFVDSILDDSRRYSISPVSDNRASRAHRQLRREISLILLTANGAMQRSGRLDA
jgi:hypothetical protein